MNDSKIIKLCSVKDNLQAEMILDVLKQNSIYAYKKDIENAGILNIYSGNSSVGEDIFIQEKDKTEAINLTEIFLHTEDNGIRKRKYSKFTQIISIIILASFVILFGIVFIAAL